MQNLQDLILISENIVFFGGAGVSTESGMYAVSGRFVFFGVKFGVVRHILMRIYQV